MSKELKLEVKCISCGEKKTIVADSPEAQSQPMCTVCGMPMLAHRATGGK
jgi:ribosomal protein S27E